METKNELLEVLQTFVGKDLVNYRPSSLQNSIFSFEFEDEKHGIMVYSSWRLLHEGKKICTWKDHYAFFTTQMDQIDGLKIKSIAINDNLDLNIEIDHNYVLQVFCDMESDEDFDNDNWFVWSNETYYAVANDLSLIVEENIEN